MGMINLSKFGTLGVILFIGVLFVFECLFGIIGMYISNYFGLNGFEWWIVTLAVIIIGNMIFVHTD